MKTLFLILLIALVPHISYSLTDAEAERVISISESVKQEREAKYSVMQKLIGAKGDIALLNTQVASAKEEAIVFEKKFDDMDAYATDQHEKWMTAEKIIAQKTSAIIRRNGIIAGLILTIGIFLYLRFR